MAFTVRPAPAVEIKSAEVKETLDRAFTRANRYDSGFLLVTSGASLNATLEKGKALIGGASVGIDADSNEAISFAASTANQGVYVKDDGTVVVSTTDPATGDFIKVWSADADGTGVTGTPTDLRDTTLQFGSPIRSTRVVIDNAPTANTHGANKEYVDDQVASAGAKPVRAASAANVTLATDVENGDTLDGVVLATGDRILLKNQSTGAENGIWVVAASGAPTRPDDFSATADVRGGFTVTVSEGTANAHREYILTTDDPITVGSTALTFALHSVQGQKGTNSGLATLNGSGVHTLTERPSASTTEKGDALVGTATPGALAAAAAVGASTTRWAREDHQHNHGDRSADVATHHSIAQLSDSGEIIQRDGSVPFTADQSFGGFKATSLADGTAATHAATVGQVASKLPKYAYYSASASGTTGDVLAEIEADSGKTLIAWEATVFATSANALRVVVTYSDATTDTIGQSDANAGYVYNASGSIRTNGEDAVAWSTPGKAVTKVSVQRGTDAGAIQRNILVSGHQVGT